MKFTLQVADPLLDLVIEKNLLTQQPPTSSFNAIISTTKRSLFQNENKNNSPADFEIMTKKLHKICSDEFDAYELEECSTWIGFIQESLQAALLRKNCHNSDADISPVSSCHAVYVLVTVCPDDNGDQDENEGQSILAAGAVAEIYLEAKAAMISYIVTDPKFRGQGLGKKIVQYLAWHMNQISIAYSDQHQPLACLLVDVAQHCDAGDDEEEKKLAMERQLIWSKLGFSPVDFDMKYPGYLGTARYNVGCYRGKFSLESIISQNCKIASDEAESKIFLDRDTFLTFLIIMYSSIWVDEAALLTLKENSAGDNEEGEEEEEKTSLKNPEVLKRTIQKTVDDLKEQFKSIPEKMLVDDKFWSIILGKAKYVLEVNLLNAHNKWERAYVHDDVVKGFMCCKCLLLCTRNCHPDPQRRQHFIVDSWNRLLDIHHPDNLYRVTPQTASGIEGFLAAMAVCKIPGSPFNLSHRIDHVPYRCTLTYKSPVRAAVETCFKRLQREGKFSSTQEVSSGHLPFSQIEFDAVLKAPKHAGIVVCRPTINTVQITHFQNMLKFIGAPEMFETTGLDPVPWKEIHPDVRKRHLFLAAETPVPIQIQPQLVALGKSCDPPIHLLHRKGLQYEFVG